MDKDLSILLLEDDPADADLVARALRKAGLKFALQRVEDKAAFTQALQQSQPDLLLIDYNLPSMNGLEALALAQKERPQTPFIFVSGSMGEDLAIETLRKGATDYVLKSRLSRLAPAVERALKEAATRAERSRAEAALASSEQKFSAAFKSAPYAMGITELESGRFVDVNETFETWTGFSRQEVIGRAAKELPLWPEPEQRDRLVAAAKKEGSFHGQACRLRLKSGEMREVVFSGTVFALAGQSYMVNVAQDVTDTLRGQREREEILRKESAARAQAEQANRAKDEFLALVSHELRTPLTTIQGLAWLLRSEGLEAEERERNWEVVERNLERERQVIDDLLDISSLDQDRLRLNKQPLDLGPLVANAAATFKSEAEEKSMRLVCESVPGLLVEGDSQRLSQIFLNLISNAIKFGPKKGTVRVSMAREKDRVLTSIEDTGSGISPEFFSRLFEPFSQQENPLTRSHGGLGLGLTIVKRLAELHGGTVWADAPAEGRGAKLTVALPLCAPAPEAAPAPAPRRKAAARGTLSGLQLLIVDDNEDTRKTLVSLLRHFGAEVRSAASASEGFDSFRKQPPDVLLCDLAMPGEDGFSMLRRVRALPAQDGGQVPAAALTGFTSREDRAKVLKAGFQSFIAKPVNPPDLAKLVLGLAKKSAA